MELLIKKTFTGKQNGDILHIFSRPRVVFVVYGLVQLEHIHHVTADKFSPHVLFDDFTKQVNKLDLNGYTENATKLCGSYQTWFSSQKKSTKSPLKLPEYCEIVLSLQ